MNTVISILQTFFSLSNDPERIPYYSKESILKALHEKLLTLYRSQNFGLIRSESISRQEIVYLSNDDLFLDRVENMMGKEHLLLFP